MNRCFDKVVDYKKKLNYLRKLHTDENPYVKFILYTEFYLWIYIRM